MSARHARLRLRYRPASDVLSGEIELGTLAADHRVVESPDADTHIEWRPGLHLDGLMLAAFQVVHASALVEGEVMRRLPPEVVNLSRQLIRTGRGALRAGASTIEQVQARADAEAHLTDSQLLRPAAAPELVTPRPARRTTRNTVARSRSNAVRPPAALAPPDGTSPAWRAESARFGEPPLLRLTDTVDDAGDVLDAIDAGNAATAIEQVATAIAALEGDDDLGRNEQLVRLLRELAGVLRDQPGTTSPGTSAAARRAIRGGLALSNSERARLRWALATLDQRDRWGTAIDELHALAGELGRPRPVPRRRATGSAGPDGAAE